MISKAKKIVINGEDYFYKVSGFVSVTWQEPDGKKFSWHWECKPKWQTQVKPSDIRAIILREVTYGSYRSL